jgi:hypothetical protein
MPAKDIVHDLVKNALEKDGWIITHDPYFMPVGKERTFIDLGAEKILAATKENQKIAVEIKSFAGASDLVAFRDALGQYLFYKAILNDFEQDRVLFLAVGNAIFSDFFLEAPIKKIWELYQVKVLVFDENNQNIIKWIQ